MKSNYVVRARKFLESFVPYLIRYKRIEDAVNAYNLVMHRHVEYHYGAVRRCLCLADYAVKWDYDVKEAEIFGGCEQELNNYNLACQHGYDYLFAEITPVLVMGRMFYVMPRVKCLAISFGEYEPDSRLSCDEYDFIYDVMGLSDLHDENWGLINGQVKIIDYACCSGAA